MKSRTLKQLLLYNYRYWFAYATVFGFILFFLGWRLSHLPPGLAPQELTNAARHLTLSSMLELPIYPLHSLLQWASISLLGISAFSLRLPSVVIALIVAFLLYHLLKRWFGKPTALLSIALFISADWFLFIARFGGGGIEFSFWLTLALLCFTKLIEHKTKWLLLFAITIAAFLFVPFGIYAALTLCLSLFCYRVFRERMLKSGLGILVPSVLVVLIGLIAGIYTSWQNPEFLKNILGMQNVPTVADYIRNFFTNTSAVVAVLPSANPMISPSGIFFVRFFELIFILFGVVMLWRTRVNRLNLTVLILSVVLVLVGGLSSGSRGGGLILVPAAIYMTAGIRHLLHRWQRTFPKNPYARIGAYVPLAILFIFAVSLHYVSYFKLWPSQSATYVAFTPDFALAKTELNKPEYIGKSCFVDTEEESMQQLLTASNTSCKPLFSSSASAKQANAYILKPGTDRKAFTDSQTTHALVGITKNDNVRWVVVQ